MKRKPRPFEEFLECVIGVSMDHYKHQYDVETRMEVSGANCGYLKVGERHPNPVYAADGNQLRFIV